MHFIAQLEAGRIYSDVMPLDKTIEVMSFMDNLRKEFGVIYKTEKIDQ